MTSRDLLIALYDILLRQLHLAKRAFGQRDLPAINQYLQKAQRILLHLDSTLEDQYEVSAHLHALYEYFIHVIVQANVKKDPAELEEIIPMLQELRQSFAVANKEQGKEGSHVL